MLKIKYTFASGRVIVWTSDDCGFYFASIDDARRFSRRYHASGDALGSYLSLYCGESEVNHAR